MKSFGCLGDTPTSQPPAPVAAEVPVASETTSAPTPQAATPSEQGLHKRQISETIPKEERENERTEGPQVAQETPQQENEATQAIRKSQRARKPKRRN
jgi:hypothetical protein